MSEASNVYTLKSLHHSDPPEKTRVACRGIVFSENKVLLSHEVNEGVYMSPGGGVEQGETFEECCARELLEETGYVVEPYAEFVTIKEYCFETLHISRYYICKVTGEGVSRLTETEIDHGMRPEWVDINEALEFFSKYAFMREDKGSMYHREYIVFSEFLKNRENYIDKA